jgi:multidrug efflux pump subunit AcrA (membrane-fusion protein)
MDVIEQGEHLGVPERVIVAPSLGVFQPHAPATITAEGGQGEVVAAGQVIGHVESSGEATPVRSPFSGFLMGMLARPGERVREGQPIAWLRAFASDATDAVPVVA